MALLGSCYHTCQLRGTNEGLHQHADVGSSLSLVFV